MTWFLSPHVGEGCVQIGRCENRKMWEKISIATQEKDGPGFTAKQSYLSSTWEQLLDLCFCLWSRRLNLYQQKPWLCSCLGTSTMLLEHGASIVTFRMGSIQIVRWLIITVRASQILVKMTPLETKLPAVSKSLSPGVLSFSRNYSLTSLGVYVHGESKTNKRNLLEISVLVLKWEHESYF